jgi:hypothetical protein
LKFYFFCIGIGLGLSSAIDNFFAFEHFKNADSYNIEPFIERETGG